MKHKLVVLFIGLAVLLSACERASITPHAHTPTPVPELSITRVPPTAKPTVQASPTRSPLPSPTDLPTSTILPSPTATPTSTSTSLPTRLRPSLTPTSSGPLSAAIYVANCRIAPTPDKPGNVIVQISIEAAGGNGMYRYFNQGVESTSKFIDIMWERGTRLIGTVTVISGDGQTVDKEYDIVIGELECK
jgi:hypothetical protein